MHLTDRQLVLLREMMLVCLKEMRSACLLGLLMAMQKVDLMEFDSG